MSDTTKQAKHIRQNNIFTISASANFLPSFVDALINGKIIQNYVKDGNIQYALSETIIYVPTRRAERALRLCFIELNANFASFLPDIRAIGDSDEDSAFFQNFDENIVQATSPLSDVTRLTNLAKLIQPWRKNLPKYLQSLYENSQTDWQNASMADALWLAQDLVKLIDEVEIEGGDWAKLAEIAKDDVAEWWQITLEFLKIIDQYCPQLLSDQKPISHAAWRNQTLKQTADFLQQTQPQKPIIVLGSTGSIPAVADLMKIISTLPKGAIILPHLDLTMDALQWQNLDKAEDDISLFGHPQYCLKQLLKTLHIDREHVIELAKKTEIAAELTTIISETMRIAETTDHWVNLSRKHFTDICNGFSLIEAVNEREEALSIAVALRHAIEDKNKNAALVTNNRHLARRVVAELLRFGIKANDSGGIPLAQTAPTQILRLIIEYMFNPNNIVALLSLLKHPLAKFSQKDNFGTALLEQFELIILRGCVGRITLNNFDAFVKQRLDIFYNDSKAHYDNKQEIGQKIKELTDSFIQATAPLKDIILQQKTITLAAMTRATISVLDNIMHYENSAHAKMHYDEANNALRVFLQNLLEHGDDFTFEVKEWQRIIEAFMQDHSVSPAIGGHPRLFIWGTLESRLQTVDTVIIGDLNEGSLPAKQNNDPFLSRPMKTTIELAPPEKRIGLAAHDFQSLLHNKAVILSRSLRVDNAPSVPSRWLQRLQTVLGHEACQKMQKRGAVYIHWARALETSYLEKNQQIAFSKQPYPIPPKEARPKQFSVTEIEVLRRDPYAIYAKKILRLKPLDTLIRDPNMAERGTLYHAIMADMIDKKIDVYADTAKQALADIARQQFNASALPLDIEALWWPRFALLIPHIITYQQSLSKRQIFVEITAEPTLIGKTGVYLSGRADRIDVIEDMAEIIDYKTGGKPSVKQASSLIAPQLALEAALLQRNAFAQIQNSTTEQLFYIRLKDKGVFTPESICNTNKKTAYALGEEAWARLTELMEYYQQPHIGYLSRAMPPIVNYEGDYDHLARVLEWSSLEDSDAIGES